MIEFKNISFRKATKDDIPFIWEILQQCIFRRKLDGSTQWQDGYPNEQTIANDVYNSNAYVLVENQKVVATAALIFNDEPTYENIDGKWLTENEFLVVHRVGVSNEVLGKGYALKIFQFVEKVALKDSVYSIKVDTHSDNKAMLGILEKLGYIYCGEIQVRDGKRRAFEKVLEKN